MTWIRRMLLALPFCIAAFLNVRITFADRLSHNLQRVVGYGFLFGAPWTWLTDRGWLNIYIAILWIPALLYSGCLWLAFQEYLLWAHRGSR
jgi:hypothetical protein